MNTITQLYDRPKVRALVQQSHSVGAVHSFGVNGAVNQAPPTVSQLRVAAYFSLADHISEKRVVDLLKNDTVNGAEVFVKWSDYINALQNVGQKLTLDQLLSFATAGLLANRQIEVRSTLSQKAARDLIQQAAYELIQSEWPGRVKSSITIAVLLLVRQDNHNDYDCARQLILQLATDQRQIESEWLSSQTNQRRSAGMLLGLYHLAQAVKSLSECLLAASQDADAFAELASDFASQQRSLLSRAEEYLSLSSDLETILWFKSIAVILWQLQPNGTRIRSPLVHYVRPTTAARG